MATDGKNNSQQATRITDIVKEPRRMLMPIRGFENSPLVSLEEAVKPLISIMPKIQDYVYVAKKRCKAVPDDGLTKDQSASIMLYTMDWEPQQECLYYALNATLRAEDRQKLRPWFSYLKLILTALIQLPSTRNFVYRGVKMDLRQQYPMGETFVWWGFSSCTSKVEVLDNEQFLGKAGKRTIFTIDCQSGKNISRHSYFQSEHEVLILPARQFEVVSYLEAGFGLHMIQLKETEADIHLLEMIPKEISKDTAPPMTMAAVKDTNALQKPWLECQFHDAEQTVIIRPHEFKISNQDCPSLSHIKSGVLDRIRGSIFGLVLGDALGAHAEFRPHAAMVAHPVKDLEGGGTWGLQAGQFTDDTSMAICLANSLIACRDFVPYDQLVRYKWWYRHGYMSSTGSCFDINAATRNSIQEFENRQKIFAQKHGIPLDEMDSLADPDLLKAFDVNCSKPNVAGNGALMRLAPVPLFFCKHPEIAVQYSGISSKITHGDDKSIDACRYYGALIVAALQGEKREALLNKRFYDEHEEWFGKQKIHPDIMEIAKGSYQKPGGYAEGIRGKGYVVDALEAALWAFWSDDDSFEKGVLNAVNLGDDTDTTAAIYGQLAGAYYGYNRLPKKWVERIYAKDFILCVSSWIAYEGNRWAKAHTVQEKKQKNKPTRLVPSVSKTLLSMPKVPAVINNNGSESGLKASSLDDIREKVIVRKAINPNGRLGSFYDASQDYLLESSRIYINIESKLVHPKTKCMMIKGDQLKDLNILAFIDASIDLRLSILSGLVPVQGIASVLDYPYTIDESTRILYYSYVVRQEGVVDSRSIGSLKRMTTSATHVVTAIDRGVEVVVLIRVPTDDQKQIDSALQQLCSLLKQNKELSVVYPLLTRIDSIYVYSNNSNINQSKTLLNVIKEIHKITMDFNEYQPCNYFLHSIDIFCSDPIPYNIKYIPIEPAFAKRIEDHWLRCLSVKKIWKIFLKQLKSDIWQNELKHVFGSAQAMFTELAAQYEEEKKGSQDLIIRIRQGKVPHDTIKHKLRIQEHEVKAKHDIDKFKYELSIMVKKDNFINHLKGHGFKYTIADKYGIGRRDTEEMMQKRLIRQGQIQRFLCSNDHLNKVYESEIREILKQIWNEKVNNPNLGLVYVDFTYCPRDLDTFKVFPQKDYSQTRDTDEIHAKLEKKSNPQSITRPVNQTFNIILIGRTGVGKSTLINAIGNCLPYKSIDDLQARDYSLHILVPFVIRLDNGSKIDVIQVGDDDLNENLKNPHPSRTQQCKLHQLNMKYESQLSIIDTPGFSDLQDHSYNDRTMQHILSYISTLTHLDAICVVIDSTNPQLDDYQLPLTKLIAYLGEKFYDKFFFLFTKCLSIKDSEKLWKNEVQSLHNLLSRNKIKLSAQHCLRFDSGFLLDMAKRRWSNRHRPDNSCNESWTMSKIAVDSLIDHLQQK